MNKWNDLCFIVSTHQKKNTKENILQLEIENFLEKLGWSRKQGHSPCNLFLHGSVTL